MDDSPITVLLVEDDDDIAALVTAALENEGLQVRAVVNGEEALAALDAERPDVLLLDLMLPDLDGLELAARVRERYASGPYLPILMLTALDTPNYRQLGFARGADDYITKPFDLTELLARVRVWAGASRRVRDLHRARARLEAERGRDGAYRPVGAPEATTHGLREVAAIAAMLGAHPHADPEVRQLCERLRQATERLVASVGAPASADLAADGSPGAQPTVSHAQEPR